MEGCVAVAEREDVPTREFLPDREREDVERGADVADCGGVGD